MTFRLRWISNPAAAKEGAHAEGVAPQSVYRDLIELAELTRDVCRTLESNLVIMNKAGNGQGRNAISSSDMLQLFSRSDALRLLPMACSTLGLLSQTAERCIERHKIHGRGNA